MGVGISGDILASPEGVGFLEQLNEKTNLI
jgi:hypothetical protein